MSPRVLLNSLSELRIRDTFNNTVAQMLDSIYHVTLK